MMRKAMITAVGTALLGLSAAAIAGRPAIFQPDTPPNWTQQDKQVANKALDTLFDSCPAVSHYLTKVQGDYSMHFMKYPDPAAATSNNAFWTKSGWHRILVLNVTLKGVLPLKWTSSSSVKQWKDQAHIAFFMGAGSAPGVWIQTSHWGDKKNARLAEHLVCGSGKVQWIETPAIKDFDDSIIPASNDAYIHARGLKVIDQLN